MLNVDAALELEAHGQLHAAGRRDRGDLPEGSGRFDGVDSLPVGMVDHVEGADGKTQVRRFVVLVLGDGKVVAPAQIDVDVAGPGLGVAAHALGARIEEAVPVGVGAGEDGPRRAGVGDRKSVV